MESMKEEVIALFKEKYNCCQSIFLPYSKLFGIDRETALKMSSGFGGGIARMGEICGAINGAVMVLGLKYGSTDNKDIEQKEKLNSIIREFVKKFKTSHKNIYCRTLLTEDEGVVYKMHSDKCASIVEEVCDLLDEYLEIRRKGNE